MEEPQQTVPVNQPMTASGVPDVMANPTNPMMSVIQDGVRVLPDQQLFRRPGPPPPRGGRFPPPPPPQLRRVDSRGYLVRGPRPPRPDGAFNGVMGADSSAYRNYVPLPTDDDKQRGYPTEDPRRLFFYGRGKVQPEQQRPLLRPYPPTQGPGYSPVQAAIRRMEQQQQQQQQDHQDVDRPGSRAGERPPSRSGDLPPDNQSVRSLKEHDMERPNSRSSDRPPSRTGEKSHLDGVMHKMERPPSREGDRPASRADSLRDVPSKPQSPVPPTGTPGSRAVDSAGSARSAVSGVAADAANKTAKDADDDDDVVVNAKVSASPSPAAVGKSPSPAPSAAAVTSQLEATADNISIKSVESVGKTSSLVDAKSSGSASASPVPNPDLQKVAENSPLGASKPATPSPPPGMKESSPYSSRPPSGLSKESQDVVIPHESKEIEEDRASIKSNLTEASIVISSALPKSDATKSSHSPSPIQGREDSPSSKTSHSPDLRSTSAASVKSATSANLSDPVKFEQSPIPSKSASPAPEINKINDSSLPDSGKGSPVPPYENSHSPISKSSLSSIPASPKILDDDIPNHERKLLESVGTPSAGSLSPAQSKSPSPQPGYVRSPLSKSATPTKVATPEPNVTAKSSTPESIIKAKTPTPEPLVQGKSTPESTLKSKPATPEPIAKGKSPSPQPIPKSPTEKAPSSRPQSVAGSHSGPATPKKPQTPIHNETVNSEANVKQTVFESTLAENIKFEAKPSKDNQHVEEKVASGTPEVVSTDLPKEGKKSPSDEPVSKTPTKKPGSAADRRSAKSPTKKLSPTKDDDKVKQRNIVNGSSTAHKMKGLSIHSPAGTESEDTSPDEKPKKRIVRKKPKEPLIKKQEGDHDSGVDESTQGKENGDMGSPSKQRLASPTKTPSRSPLKGLKQPEPVPEKKKVPMNKVQVGAAPSPNLKAVRSKIGSLDNATYKPGGGKVKIEHHKLDFSKTQPKIAAKNDQYTPKGGDKKIQQVKLQWNAKPKVGSLDNATHKPGGGDKKIETVKLDFKEKAKPKVGSKDNVKHTPGGGNVKSDSEQKSDNEAPVSVT